MLLTDFLGNAMPALQSMISSGRDKIISQFKKVTFPVPGMVIHREGEPVTRALIIRKGECMMVSHRIPVNLSVVATSDYDAVKKSMAKKHKFTNTTGYFSKTTNSMQIGVLSEN